MRRRRFFGLAALPAILLVFGILIARAQEQSPPETAGTIPAGSSYQAQVKAVQAAFATERASLELSNTSGQSSTPEADLGEPPCASSGGGSGGGSASQMTSGKAAPCTSCAESSKGAPVWRVNMVNLNFYMTDTPMWYSTPVGPSVELRLSYNSQTGLSGPFGNKWQLSYGSYLYPAVNNIGGFAGMMIIMPDGKQQLYVPDGFGGYTPPYQSYNKLSNVAVNRFELKFTDGRVFVYDIPEGTTSSVSLLVEVKDAYGQKLSMGYSADAKLTTITDALGKVTAFSYNAIGLVTQAADPFGRVAAFEYDANKNLTKITDMGGYWTSFTYRQYVLTDYYLSGLTNAAGSWGFYIEPEDGLNNADAPYPAPGTAMCNNTRITVTNPFGDKEEYYRLKASGLISSWYVSPRDYIPYSSASSNNYASHVPRTNYTFINTFSRKSEIYSNVTPEGNTTAYSYNDIINLKNTGNITNVSNGLSYHAYTYNAIGKITSITAHASAGDTVTTLTYAANGVDLTGITSGLGTITMAYNAAHDITSYTDRSGNTETTAYNGYGQKTSTSDALGITTNYTYDANHRLAQITRSGQTLMSYTYDAVGRVRTAVDAAGMTRTYDYNTLNDVLKITYPDGKFIDFTYSSGIPHLITGMTDRGGKTTQYTYSASKKLTGIMNAAGESTTLNRDKNGNLLQLIDPIGHSTGFEFDKDNRLAKKTFADGTVASYTHDGKNRLASSTGARSLSTFYAFDLNDNLSGISYTIDSSHYTFPVMFQYDPFRRMINMADDVGTTAFTYNADSLVTSIDGPLVNDTLTFQYDAKKRLTGYALQLGQSVSYTYDALDRLTSIQGSAGTFSYAYSGASPLIQRLTRPNGSYTEYQYDSMNRLVLLSNKTSTGEIINQYAYAYNAQDLRSSESITNGAPVTSFINGATTYSYNNVNALLGSTNPSKTFIYDADGNTTQWDAPDGKTLTGVYDIENRLISAGYEYFPTPSTLESYKGVYKYSGNGMMAQKEETTYISSLSFYEKKVVKFVVYGRLPLQERDKTNAVLREYTWGSDSGGGIGGLLSMKQGGQNYFNLYDGKGNVTAIIDSSQSVVAAYSYDSFGNILTKTGTLDQPYRFSTKPYDEKTGLSYFGYRFYSPSSGRWISRDPLGETAGLNLYEFLKNDPVNRWDPDGRDDCGPGEERLETRIDNDDDTFSTGFICAPERSTWQKILDWLASQQVHTEQGSDRALAHQCRKTAGWEPPASTPIGSAF